MRDLLKNAAYLSVGTMAAISNQAKAAFETVAAQAVKTAEEGEQIMKDFSAMENFSLPRDFALSSTDIIAEIQY